MRSSSRRSHDLGRLAIRPHEARCPRKLATKRERTDSESQQKYSFSDPVCFYYLYSFLIQVFYYLYSFLIQVFYYLYSFLIQVFYYLYSFLIQVFYYLYSFLIQVFYYLYSFLIQVFYYLYSFLIQVFYYLYSFLIQVFYYLYSFLIQVFYYLYSFLIQVFYYLYSFLIQVFYYLYSFLIQVFYYLYSFLIQVFSYNIAPPEFRSSNISVSTHFHVLASSSVFLSTWLDAAINGHIEINSHRHGIQLRFLNTRYNDERLNNFIDDTYPCVGDCSGLNEVSDDGGLSELRGTDGGRTQVLISDVW